MTRFDSEPYEQQHQQQTGPYLRQAKRSDLFTWEVDEAAVRTLLEAAMAAPSAMTKDPWRFVVVRDLATLTALKTAQLPDAGLDAYVDQTVDALRHSGMETLDIPAFLRKQAD